MLPRTVSATAALLVAATAAPAQRLEPRPVPSIGVESFTFQSPSMGVRFAVNVGRPLGYHPDSVRAYPALVTTDGDWAFGGVYDAARSLMTEGAIDSLFVVSIGTAFADGDSTWVRRRIYEFSPPGWDLQDRFGQVVAGACRTYRSEPDRCVGGAPRFLDAIVTELIPLVTRQYRIDPDRLGLFGISAGGFFASWTMFQQRAPFRKYLISSPAMAYGRGEIYRLEERWARDHRDLPVAVYFGAGGLEAQHPMYEGIGEIMSGMLRLGGLLAGRNYPGLSLTTEIHPGMSHGDVMSTVAVRGLRVLYGRAGAR